MKNTKKTASILTIIIILITVIYFIIQSMYSKKSDEWIVLTTSSKGESGFTPEGLLNEIPLPEIRNIQGKAKFIERNGYIYLGYKVSFNIDSLDKKEIPKKYLKDKIIDVNGFQLTAVGIDQVEYHVSFNFTFFDKDRFLITKIESKNLTVESGRKNEIQDFIKKGIDDKAIELTETIELEIFVNKCLTCGLKK